MAGRRRWVIGLIRVPVHKDVWLWLTSLLMAAMALSLFYGDYANQSLPARLGNTLGTSSVGWFMFMIPRRLVYSAYDGVRATMRRSSQPAARIPSSESALIHPEEEIVLPSTTKRDVMIVYGRNVEARNALADFLRTLGLNPLQWNELVADMAQGSPYIGEVVARAFQRAQAVIVLMTPDEHVMLRADLGKDGGWAMQPRPNVLLEAGMALMHQPDRTIIVQMGKIRPVSDLEGRHVVRLGTEPNHQALVDLALRLQSAGCSVNRTGGDWLDTERFTRIKALTALPVLTT